MALSIAVRVMSTAPCRTRRATSATTGSVRVFATPVSKTCEEVVELVPDRRLSYTLLSGLPFVGYRADIDLEPRPGGGTQIRWCSRFRVKHLGTRWFWTWSMKRTLRTATAQLADGAANPAIAPQLGLDPRTRIASAAS